MLVALLVGSGFAFATNGGTTTITDTSAVTEAKRIEHAEAVDLRLAQEKAEANFIAWVTAAKKAEDEAKWYAAVAEAERLEAERVAAEKAAAAAAAKKAAAAKVAAAAPKSSAPSGGSSAYGAGAAPGPCAGWEGTIAAHFPAEQVAKACRVMMCESGGNPNAANPRSTASGLFQFLNSTWESTTGTPAPASAYGGSTQIAAAAKLWRSSGWSPWVCA